MRRSTHFYVLAALFFAYGVGIYMGATQVGCV